MQGVGALAHRRRRELQLDDTTAGKDDSGERRRSATALDPAAGCRAASVPKGESPLLQAEQNTGVLAVGCIAWMAAAGAMLALMSRRP